MNTLYILTFSQINILLHLLLIVLIIVYMSTILLFLVLVKIRRQERRPEELQRLDITNNILKFEITDKVHTLSPQSIPSQKTLNFNFPQYPFIVTNLSDGSLFVIFLLLV